MKLTITPGAHLITTHVEKWGGGGSAYNAHRAAGQSLSYQISFTPKNPFNWTRFRDGVTTISDESVGTTKDHLVSLYGSDVDAIIVDEQGQLRLIASKGNGRFATSQTIYQSTSNGQTHLLVRTLDIIGRSSIILAYQENIQFLFNDGIHGYKPRLSTIDIGENDGIRAIDARDIDGDHWMELIVGLPDKIGLLSGVADFYQGTQNDLLVETIDISGPIFNNPVLGLTFDQPLSGNGNQLPSILAGRRLNGQVLLLTNMGQGQFGEPELLAGLTTEDPSFQLAGLALGEFNQSNIHLAAAFGQQQQVLIWQKSESWPLVKTIDLPIRPLSLSNSSSQAPGLIISGHQVGVIFLVTWDDVNDVQSVRVLYSGLSQMQLASFEGTFVAIDQQAGKILIYQ